CRGYDNKIKSLGGLDIQMLGIGRTGHVGFNEPGSQPEDETRLVHLNEVTIEDAAKDFNGKENVPRTAITMGVKTILQADRVFLMGWGQAKSDIIKAAVERAVTSEVPASFLQKHPDTLFVVDSPAGAQLSRIETPWLAGECEWTDKMQKKALIWLSGQTKKPILKLTEADYKSWGLNSLLQTKGKAYDLNIEIHNKLQQTITGWPGGKPESDDKTRPERSEPFPKRVIVFSPHPDDDVISMGGTFIRLAEQGHDVHVAYQTSGNIAVFDDDAHRYMDFLRGISRQMSLCVSDVEKFYNEITGYLKENPGNGNKHPAVLDIKGQIRKGEAIAACRFSGVTKENIHFLDLPFYETGSVEKNPASQDDVDIIVDLLREVRPHQIYAAGDLQDPHGTHAVCLHVIFDALKMVKEEEWAKDC
ncbi:MAG TPA: PIG-L family deacetylase, partial [Bacteroidales bacterium]|nr:PIG-L family deacetylase [Bacteroidales bacterium]